MSTNVGDAFFFSYGGLGKSGNCKKHNFILRKPRRHRHRQRSKQASESVETIKFSIRSNSINFAAPSTIFFPSFQLISLRSSTAWSWTQASLTRRARQAQTIGILILSKRGNERKREKKRKICLLSTPIGRCYSTCFTGFFSFMLFASLHPWLAAAAAAWWRYLLLLCSWLCCGISQAKEESEKRKIADKMIAIKTVLRLTSLRSSVVSLGYEFFKLFIVYQHTRARRELKGLPGRRRWQWKFN